MDQTTSLSHAPEPIASESVSERLPYIDGTRALAILGVVVYTVIAYLPPATVGALNVHLMQLLLTSAHAVDVFCVLSGFALAYPVLHILRADHIVRFDVDRYIARRIVRIVPWFFLAVGALAIIALAIPGGGRLHALPVGWGPGDLLRQLLFLDANATYFNGSFWALAVIARWYIIFPFALLLWIRAPRAFWLTIVALPLLTYLTRAHNVDSILLPGFLLGIVAADVRVRQHRSERFALGLMLVAAVLAYLAQGWLQLPDDLRFGRGRVDPLLHENLGWQAAAFFLVVGIGNLGAFGRLFASELMGWLGAAAFAIYLYAEPVVALVIGVGSPMQTGWAFAFAASMAAIAVGVIIWRLTEGFFRRSRVEQHVIDSAAGAIRSGLEFLGIAPSLILTDPSAVPAPTRGLADFIEASAAERAAAEQAAAATAAAQAAQDLAERQQALAETQAAAVERRNAEALVEAERRRSEAEARETAQRKRQTTSDAQELARLEVQRREAAVRQAAADRAARERKEASIRAAAERADRERQAAEVREATERAKRERHAAEARVKAEHAIRTSADHDRQDANHELSAERIAALRAEIQRKAAQRSAGSDSVDSDP